MTAIERLHVTLASLGLTAIEAKLDGLLERASKAETSYAEFLADVLGAEADARRQRYLKTRLQLAHLPYVKSSSRGKNFLLTSPFIELTQHRKI